MKKDIKDSAYSIATEKPVAITMIALALIIFGYLALSKLALNLMPDMAYPSITVRTEYPGSAPEEVENSISKPVEQLLGVVNNLENISSISKAGQSDVILEFSWNTDMNQAMMDVREQLDRFFFEDAQKPLILRYDPTLDPILRLALYRNDNDSLPKFTNNIDFLKRTRRYADEQLKRKIEIIQGVAAVKVKGGLEEEIRVRISETKLNLLNLSIQSITQRLQNENVNVAGGNIKEGTTEYIVRTLNEFQDVNEIENIIIGYKNLTTPIYLRDISDVSRSYKDRQIVTRFGDSESVEIEIFKEADANIVDVAKKVRETILGTEEQKNYVKRNNSQEFKIDRTHQRLTDFLAFELKGEGLAVDVLSDQSIFIKNSIDEVKGSAYLGGFFAVIVLFIFLRDIKSTLIIGVVIPISVLTTFWPMDLFGVSLNLMSLGGLALGIGMLVDNAIVVLESIYRCREEGDSFTDSVVRGTKEVGGAVVASTLTTIAVFFPIVFVEGVAGQIFGDMALTVVFSLISSLIAALYLIPMLTSRRLKKHDLLIFKNNFFKDVFAFKFFDSFNRIITNVQKFNRLETNEESSFLRKIYNVVINIILYPFIIIYSILRFLLHLIAELIGKFILLILFGVTELLKGIFYLFSEIITPFLLKTIVKYISNGIDYLQNIYPSVIRYSLDNKVNILTLLMLPVIITAFYIVPNMGSELIPQVHQGEFNVELSYAIGTPVETTSENTLKIGKEIKALPEVISVSSRSGVDKSATTKAEEGEHSSKITVVLNKNSNMKEFESKVISKIRKMTADLSGVDVKITRNELFSFKTPIEVYIKGFDLEKLKSYSNEAYNKIAGIEGLVDPKSNIRKGNPEIHIIYNREKIALYKLNLFNVANLVKNKVLGDVSTKFREKDRRIDITVLLAEEDKESISKLSRLIINPGQDTPIRLEAIADIKVAEGPSEIRRNGQERTAVITANTDGTRDLKSIIDQIDYEISTIAFDQDFFYEIAGQNKEMETSINSLIGALLLAIFLVYIIMASQFESFVHPFVILFSIPLAFIGVFVLLYLMGVSLSIMTYLGMIMLSGIVVNNAIVLISHINLLRSEGMEKREAIIEGGRVRLRPILMTTATTVLGLLPMALGLGDGAELRQPMALTVIAGLISSTVLTLVIIPTLYSILDRSGEVKEDNNSVESDFVKPRSI
jgi:hydrophobic/amphiphilic exporter-1 (mainly G- bacteria), HAE1 family